MLDRSKFHRADVGRAVRSMILFRSEESNRNLLYGNSVRLDSKWARLKFFIRLVIMSMQSEEKISILCLSNLFATVLQILKMSPLLVYFDHAIDYFSPIKACFNGNLYLELVMCSFTKRLRLCSIALKKFCSQSFDGVYRVSWYLYLTR